MCVYIYIYIYEYIYLYIYNCIYIYIIIYTYRYLHTRVNPLPDAAFFFTDSVGGGDAILIWDLAAASEVGEDETAEEAVEEALRQVIIYI